MPFQSGVFDSTAFEDPGGPSSVMQSTLIGTGSGAAGATTVAATATPVAGKLHLALIVGVDATARNVTGVTGCGLTWTLVGPAGGGGDGTLAIGSTVAIYKGTGTPTAGTVTATFSGAITYSRLAVVDILDAQDVVAANVQYSKVNATQLILSFNPFDDAANRSIAVWGAYKSGPATANSLSFSENTINNFGRDLYAGPSTYVYSGVSWEPDVLDLTLQTSIVGESASTYWGVAVELASASASPKTNFSAAASATTYNPGTIGSTLPSIIQAALMAVSSPAGASGTIASTLPGLTQAATGKKVTAFSAPASATTQSGGPVSGTAASVLPKITQAANAASSSAGTTATVTSPLPHLTQSAAVSTGVREESGWVTVSGTTATTVTVTSSNILPKLTQAVSGVTGGAPSGSITSTLPSLRQAVTATAGTVLPVSGTATQTLPKLTTAAVLFFGPVPTATGPINQVLPSLRQSAIASVASLPPPPTQTGVEGLVHIFQKGAVSRSLPATNSPLQVVGEFRDRASMVGGFQSATGTISPDEYNAHPEVYSVGTTWLVKSLALEAAGLPPYIFGGELKQPQPSSGTVTLAADGWGLLQDRQVERFLLASMAVDQWAPGDERPFNYPSSARIVAEVKGQRLVFTIDHDKSFKRNDAGQPNVWRSAPLVFWAPKMNLRWIKFTIKATARNINPYDLELVGTPTGPTGNLTVLKTWNLNNQNTDATFSFQIPDGYDLIGLRMIRSSEAKKPPHARVVVDDVIVGALAPGQPFTLNQAFATLFSFMGASTTQIETATEDVLPYDAARVSLADVADDLAVLGEWYWRMWANAAGGKQGEAGSIGDRDWQVQLVHTPIRLLPQIRYNVVQYDYAYGGGYTSQETVRANPDPFPGTDVVYVLNLPEPPVFVLAQRFAQKIANLVSKPWFSGSGTLFKVNPGNRPAAVVKPGDKLTLVNYGSTQVIVDEVSHSEDGNLVDVQFAEASKIVDRWLALWQQKINQGLSPNGATLALLDAAEPKQPVITAGFTMSQKREGRKDWDLVATASLVTEDIEDNGTFVSRYEFRARPVDPQTNNPISAGQGGGWRERHIRAPRDDEAEETKTAVWEKINNPKKWAWEVQGWAVDALGQKSKRDVEFPGKPADFVPVTPQSVSLDVDQRVMTVTHVIPPDPDDPTEEDQTYDHAIIRINDQNGNWASPLKQDRKVKGETKRFRFKKPIDGQTYYAQVTYVDFWGNKSNPVVVSNSKRIPPLPLIGAATFDASGTRHARYRLKVPVSVNDTGHDDYVKRIIVQMTHRATNVTPDASDQKVRDQVRANDDPQEALFRNIPKTHYVFCRAMSVDTDQKESGWTGWIAMGRPKDSGVVVIPPQPSWQALPAGQISVTTPTPRRVVADWDEPDDDEAIRWRVVFKRGGTTVDTVRTRNTRAVYRVPKADVGANHTAEVYAINDTGGESAVATGSGVPTPDDAGIATNPPNQPSNPTLSFDGRGTKHAKYRAIVTAGLSTVDSTHDAAHRYVIQLAHDATDTGASPPAGTKRQHGNVEGDATGDDLSEVFRNLPRRHHVWVRERARNAAGASPWTAWVHATRPMDTGVAIAPNPPQGVVVDTPVPRRVVVDWNEPDDDETTRWRVEIRRGGTTVKTGFTRSTRYVYRVPKQFVGVAHNARVFAISETGTDSSQVDSPDGFPEAEAEAGFEAGDLKPRAKAAIPPNWLNCNGNPYSPSTWPNLFTAIGATFGGTVSNPLLPDLRGRKNVGVSSLVALASNENQAEAARIEDHTHPIGVDVGVPGDDTAAGGLPDSTTPENLGHHHQLAVGGSNTDTQFINQVNARQGNLAGNVLTTPTSHAHQLQGQTNDRDESHWHLHAHGISHNHGHGHNQGHPHGGNAGNKKGNFLGHHWLVYAA